MKTNLARRCFLWSFGVVGSGLLLSIARPARASSPTGASFTAEKTELTIYAAASTRDAMNAIQKRYAEIAPSVELFFNFGSSGDLARQIIAAAKADVFFSADEKEMDRVAAEKLVLDGTRRDLLSNQLVVIEPVDSEHPEASIFTKPFTPSQLARPEVKLLSLANVDTVPAGRYAKAWLEKTETWKDVSGRVLPGVDVRAALGAVEAAGAQAGIVYKTDVARSRKARIVFAVPLEEGPKITYPVAVIAGRSAEREARAFVDYIASPKARASFEGFGFVFLPPAQPVRK
jgi:molybdate transport system substrate-binding protein